jgi:hypothetical protein
MLANWRTWLVALEQRLGREQYESASNDNLAALVRLSSHRSDITRFDTTNNLGGDGDAGNL